MKKLYPLLSVLFLIYWGCSLPKSERIIRLEQDGLHTEWYENGQKRTESIFKNDIQDGLTTMWYENGQKKSELTYKDGKLDGNLGYNTKLRASLQQPSRIYISDFDGDGLIEPVLCYYQKDKLYPMMLRSDLISQLVGMKEQYPVHADYAGKEIDQVFTSEQLENALEKKAFTYATSVFYGSEKGTFTVQPLPAEAQYSPVYAIVAHDFNADGRRDLLLGGNFYGVSQQFGRHDASHGTLLLGSNRGDFKPLSLGESGLTFSGQVRDMVMFTHPQERVIIITAMNNAPIQVYTIIP